jgi:Mn2+/Fe2+ NRAMP family transporter
MQRLTKGGRSFRQAPLFVTTVSALIGIGAIVALIPGLPVIALLVGVQDINGVFAPITLFFLWRLFSNGELMGESRSGRVLSTIAGATVIAMAILSLVLLAAAVIDPGGF